MNLAFCLFNYYPFGGLERNFIRITQAAISSGHSIDIYTMSWKGAKPDEAEIILVPFNGLTNHRRCASFCSKLKSILDNKKYDLVVGFNRIPCVDLYYAADVCYKVDIQHRRSFLSKLTPRYHTFLHLEKKLFSPSSSTEIMYLSATEKNNYISVYGTQSDRFHYLPPGIDKKRIRASIHPEIRKNIRRQFNISDNSHFLLMIGSDFYRKGVSRSIAALAALPEKLKDKTYLFVIGAGRVRSLKKLAVRLGVDKRVCFLGGRNDVPDFLAAADFLLHPAVSENTGNAILEAMVAGVPVLTTSICGYSFHIEKAKAGQVITSFPFNQEQMNKVLSSMLVSDQPKNWKKNALRYAEKTDLYSRPQSAVKIIEYVVKRKKS